MPSSKIYEWVDKCNEFALKSYTNRRSQHCAALIDGKKLICMSTNKYGGNKIEQYIEDNDCTSHAEYEAIIEALNQDKIWFNNLAKVGVAEGVSAF